MFSPWFLGPDLREPNVCQHGRHQRYLCPLPNHPFVDNDGWKGRRARWIWRDEQEAKGRGGGCSPSTHFQGPGLLSICSPQERRLWGSVSRKACRTVRQVTTISQRERRFEGKNGFQPIAHRLSQGVSFLFVFRACFHYWASRMFVSLYEEFFTSVASSRYHFSCSNNTYCFLCLMW